MESIFEKLIDLKIIGIKTSFEDEGQFSNKIIKLRSITSKHNLKLFIKIGGSEAKSDIQMAENLCCDMIIAPMIESAYSLIKFKNCITKIKKGINIETINAYNNIDSILNECNDIESITIGRVDFLNSFNKNRDQIDSDNILNKCSYIFKKIRDKYGNNIKLGLGGSININSYKFIMNLYKSNLIDFIETRFIIISLENVVNNFYNFVNWANLFELEWLKEQNRIDMRVIDTRNHRINFIENRINNS